MKFELNTPTEYLRQKLSGIYRIICFMALGNPLQEAICAKFDDPLNDYMTLIQAAKKLKVNTNRKRIPPPVLLN